jgi:hypothetical protein
MPFDPHFVGLAAVVMHNKVLLFFMAFSFMMSRYGGSPLISGLPAHHLRVGNGPMGPKWFTDVNPRWASPLRTTSWAFA